MIPIILFIISLFKFNCNSDLWWLETEFYVKSQSIVILSALALPFILHGSGLLVDQPFSRLMVVSPLGITFVLAILVCTEPTPKHILLITIIVYVCTVCLPIHKRFFCTVLFISLLCSSILLVTICFYLASARYNPTKTAII